MRYKVINRDGRVMGVVNAPTGEIAHQLAEVEYAGTEGLRVLVDIMDDEVAACFRRGVRAIAELMDQRSADNPGEK